MTEAGIERPGQPGLTTAELGMAPWLMLAILLLMQTVYQGGLQAVYPLAPFLQTEMEISRAQVGLLGSAMSAGTILVVLPIGMLVDRVGAHLMLFAGPATMGLALFLASRAPSYWVMFAFMLVAGAGVGMSTTAATKAVISWFTARTRGTAMGIKQTGSSLGGVLVAALLPGIALASDWRVAMALTGAAVALSGLVSLIGYRERTAPGSLRRPASSSSMWTVLRNRNLQYACTASTCFTATQMSLVTYLVLYLTEVQGMQVSAAGALLALVQVGGLSGRLLLGVASDRLFGARRKGLLTGLGVLAIFAATVTAFFGASLPYEALALLVLIFGLAGAGWTGLFVILSAELAGKQSAGQGTAMGTLSGSIGYFAGPPLFGLVVDLSHSYSLAWLGIAVVSALGVLAMVRVRERGAEVIGNR